MNDNNFEERSGMIPDGNSGGEYPPNDGKNEDLMMFDEAETSEEENANSGGNGKNNGKKKKTLSIGTTVFISIFVALITFQLTFITVNNIYENKYNDYILNSPYNSTLFTKLYELVSLYENNYIGEIDDEKTIEYVLDAYVASIDKYGSYMTVEEFEEMMKDYDAEVDGIGVHIIYNGDMSCIEIVNVMPDSPAMEAGIMPGDLIVYVEGESVAELGYYPAINLIKGERGTYTSFTVYRDGEYIDFTVMRDAVTEQTVVHHVLSYNDKVGVIRIMSFDNGTFEQFKNAVEELQAAGCESLVLDVRNNPGGLLSSVTDILDYILPEGPIVRLVDKYGNEETEYSDASHIDMPLVILCNGNTASAGELFTAAIRDYDRALVVGTLTYGKGTVQRITQLTDGDALSISYKLYSPPYSDNYEGIGITPDIEVELDESLAGKNVFKITDEEDNQLRRAVEALLGDK